MTDSAANQEPLLLAPAETSTTEQAEIGTTVRLDDLGPMVVNSDGTLSRIANWPNMSEAEREQTLRVLAKRNQIRLAAQAQRLKDNGESTEESAQKLTVLAGRPDGPDQPTAS